MTRKSPQSLCSVTMKKRKNSIAKRMSVQLLRPPTIKKKKNSITSLPKDLLTEILALVASKSVTDLANAKLSCKDFLQVSNDDYVFAHAAIDKFWIPWFSPLTNEASSFLERCKESGNPECLYRHGMYEYFSLGRIQSGMRQLKRAAEKGHLESTYVYSIILICSGNSTRLKQQGLELLSSSKSFRTREFRENIQKRIWLMWIRNMITQQEDYYHAASNCQCLKNWRRGWDDDDIVACCDACLCHRQVAFFCDLVEHSFLGRLS